MLTRRQRQLLNQPIEIETGETIESKETKLEKRKRKQRNAPILKNPSDESLSTSPITDSELLKYTIATEPLLPFQERNLVKSSSSSFIQTLYAYYRLSSIVQAPRLTLQSIFFQTLSKSRIEYYHHDKRNTITSVDASLLIRLRPFLGKDGVLTGLDLAPVFVLIFCTVLLNFQVALMMLVLSLLTFYLPEWRLWRFLIRSLFTLLTLSRRLDLSPLFLLDYNSGGRRLFLFAYTFHIFLLIEKVARGMIQDGAVRQSCMAIWVVCHVVNGIQMYRRGEDGGATKRFMVWQIVPLLAALIDAVNRNEIENK